MVEIHRNIRDEKNNIIRGRTKLFIKECDEKGEILRFNQGKTFIPENSGQLFIVDNWIIDQIHKLKVDGNTLSVKEGETLEVPEPTELEVKEAELLKQLEAIQKQKNEEA